MKKIALVVAISLVFIFCGVSHATTYNWTTLDYPGATDTYTRGISGSNIVGSYIDSTGTHGFIYDGTNYTTFDYPGAVFTQANSISGSKIVGDYSISGGNTPIRGFLYDGTNFTSLDVPGATFVYAEHVDGSNIVGGYGPGENCVLHGFIYDGTNYTTFDYPGATYTGLESMHGSNIVGAYATEAGGACDFHGFIYDGTSYKTLDYPGASLTNATDLSGNTIVGYYYGNFAHGFIYDGTNYTTFDYPGAGWTAVYGIEGSTIVGYYEASDGKVHGFLATPVPEPIAIDIKPGDNTNTINLRRMKTITVAILSTTDFSAPSAVDRATLTFGATGNESSLTSCSRKAKDVNGDGFGDLICTFSVRAADFQCGDTEGILKGRTMTGISFEGSQEVLITPCK